MSQPALSFFAMTAKTGAQSGFMPPGRTNIFSTTKNKLDNTVQYAFSNKESA